MTGREMRERLHGGQRVYGSMIIGAAVRWPAAVKNAGLDFAFLDSEHHPYSRGDLAQLCQLYAGLEVVPVVRIPSPDSYEACKALDGGAMGVIAPYVETVAQVHALVGAVRYRPLKGARLQQRLDGSQALPEQTEAYLAARNADKVAIANIESQPALDALDDILAVEGLDAVLIGPHDLSCNIGVPEQYDHPDFLAAVERIITRARAAGLGAGIHAIAPPAMRREVEWIEMGANLVVHSSDLTSFAGAMRQDLDAIKQQVGD